MSRERIGFWGNSGTGLLKQINSRIISTDFGTEWPPPKGIDSSYNSGGHTHLVTALGIVVSIEL